MVGRRLEGEAVRVRVDFTDIAEDSVDVLTLFQNEDAVVLQVMRSYNSAGEYTEDEPPELVNPEGAAVVDGVTTCSVGETDIKLRISDDARKSLATASGELTFEIPQGIDDSTRRAIMGMMRGRR